jgi:hypothetical protein
MWPWQAFGKPTITPKTPFEVKDLHGRMRLRRGIDQRLESVDNRVFPFAADVESRGSQKDFSTNER